MKRHLYLVEDRVAGGWHPFSLTRPVGEILFGALLLRDRIERAVGDPAAGYLAPPALADFDEPGAPPVFTVVGLPTDAPRLLLSSRYLPPIAEGGVASLLPPEAEGRRLTVGGETVGWLLPAGAPFPNDRNFFDGAVEESTGTELPELALPGTLLSTPWALVEANPGRLTEDLAALFPSGAGPGVRRLSGRGDLHIIGDHPVSVADGVEIDPLVVFDAREGPIHLERGVRVRSFTHLKGPAYIGAGTTLVGGSFETLTCGPTCRLRGEISASVLLGFVNKAHDGYLGHALVGRWVNLGAFTTNSDLKNNYGPIRVGAPSGEAETGLIKVGVFLGDHVKTGIGTHLNAGTVVGAGTNIYGGAFPWKWIPPFHWGTAATLGPYRLEPFLAATERAMARRGVPLTPAMRSFLSAAWRQAHPSAPGKEST